MGSESPGPCPTRRLPWSPPLAEWVGWGSGAAPRVMALASTGWGPPSLPGSQCRAGWHFLQTETQEGSHRLDPFSESTWQFWKLPERKGQHGTPASPRRSPISSNFPVWENASCKPSPLSTRYPCPGDTQRARRRAGGVRLGQVLCPGHTADLQARHCLPGHTCPAPKPPF